VRDGDRWIISGSKIWSSGAHLADWAMCLARTDWNAPKHRGLTWFAVPTHAEGVEIRPIVQINGNTGFCEEFLDEVEVNGEDIIGEVNRGWAVTQTMLVYERGAGETASIPREPRTLAPDLVALATKVGRTADPAARQAIARAHANDFAQFHLGRRIAERLRRASAPDPAVAAYSKLAAGVLTPVRARLAMEIGGPAALAWSSGDGAGNRAAMDYLNGRIISIAAGTNEMQRNGIGERVLGLPREPSFDTNKPFNEVLRSARTWDSKVG
jgi:alkylation response protein AidB-like acyl-CoA dehydrogenase